LKKELPAANFFLVEANPTHQKTLAGTGFPFQIAALSENAENRLFFSTGGTGDSLFRETTGVH
jgi:hypothetical protein